MVAAPASPRKADYFELFGLKRRFGVDRAALEKKFYELSRATHPDRFTTAGADAQRQALERMSELNDAYRTLKDPVALRQYYLELEGFELPAERPGAPGCVTGKPTQTVVGGSTGSTIPLELAESWFELQDALMEDPGSAQAKIAAFERELAGLRAKGSETLSAIEREIDQATDAGRDAPRELLERLAKEIRAQSYLKSMERDVDRIRKRL